jgi:DNA-binding PadR family transcriptional regulator
MFRDNSLIPSEAVRLAALGLLAEGPRAYGDLAAEIRHFTSRIAGPSLDLMGTSLELLRYEGLIAADASEGAENALLSITDAGRAALHALLQARLGTHVGDNNRLVLLLKLRFLPLLPAAEQGAQLAMVAESIASELARLEDLRRHHEGAPGPFLAWLDQDIAALKARLGATLQ